MHKHDRALNPIHKNSKSTKTSCKEAKMTGECMGRGREEGCTPIDMQVDR